MKLKRKTRRTHKSDEQLECIQLCVCKNIIYGLRSTRATVAFSCGNLAKKIVEYQHRRFVLFCVFFSFTLDERQVWLLPFLRFNSIRRTDYVDRETAEGADTFASSRTDPAC